MALPRSTGLTAVYSCRHGGPFLSSAGNVYFVYLPTANETPGILKNTDPVNNAFTTVVTPSSIASTNKRNMYAVQNGDVLYVIWVNNNYSTDVTTYVLIYDMSTDTYAQETVATFSSPILSDPVCGGAYDSVNDKLWIVYNSGIYTSMGKSYQTVGTAYRTPGASTLAPGTWTLDLDAPDKNATVHTISAVLAVGTDRIHVQDYTYDSVSFAFGGSCGSITKAGVLQTQTLDTAAVGYEAEMMEDATNNVCFLMYRSVSGSLSFKVAELPLNANNEITNGISIATYSTSMGGTNGRGGYPVWNPNVSKWEAVFAVSSTAYIDWYYDIGASWTKRYDVRSRYDTSDQWTVGQVYERVTNIGVLGSVVENFAGGDYQYDELQIYDNNPPGVLGAAVANALATITATASSGVINEGAAIANAVATVTAASDGTQVGNANADAIATLTAAATVVTEHHGLANNVAVGTGTAVGTTTTGETNLVVPHFQFRKHFGREDDHIPFVPIDTDINGIVDYFYGLRFLMENQSVVDSDFQLFTLKYRKNGGAWTDITQTSNNIQVEVTPVRYNYAPVRVQAYYGATFSGGVENYIMEAPLGVLHMVYVQQNINTPYYVTMYRRSTDMGVTWSTAYQIDGLGYVSGDSSSVVFEIFYNPVTDKLTMWFSSRLDATLGTIGALLISSDQGATWTTQYALNYDAAEPFYPSGGGGNVSKIIVDSNGYLYFWITYVNTVVGVSTRRYISQYKSTDGGANWTMSVVMDVTDAYGSTEILEIYWVYANPVNDDLFLIINEGNNLKMAQSINSGSSWTVWVRTIYTIDNSNTILAGASQSLGMAAIGGSDWSTVTLTFPSSYTIRDKFFVEEDGSIYFGTSKKNINNGLYYGFISVSKDEGATWQDIPIDAEYPETAGRSDQSVNRNFASVYFPRNGHHKTILYTSDVPANEIYGPSWIAIENDGAVRSSQFTYAGEDGFYDYTIHGATTGRDADDYYYSTHYVSVLCIDHRGDIHTLFKLFKDDYTTDAATVFYDAKAVNHDGADTTYNMLGGGAYGFDVTNHGCTNDGTFGPVKVFGESKMELDARLRLVPADVTNGDVIDIRIGESNVAMLVAPSITVSATETDYYADVGTIIRGAASAFCKATTNALATPRFKSPDFPTVPSTAATGVTLHPNQRKSGPFTNYDTDYYYGLFYTGTAVRFYSIFKYRDGTWAGVGSSITVGATDSIWVEQGKYGYEHLLYVAIQTDDANGAVNLYTLDTTTDTLSGPELLAGTPGPLTVCVSVAIRKVSGVPQVVVAYNGAPDGTFGNERCVASYRTCAGGAWTHGVSIDYSWIGPTWSYQNPTLAAGSEGNIHVWYMTGPEEATYPDSIWYNTLSAADTLNLATVSSGVVDTPSGFNSDLAPPGRAIAWMRDEDAWECRLLFSYQGTNQLAILRGVEDHLGRLAAPASGASLISVGLSSTAAGGFINDTAAHVLVADDGMAPPHWNHYAVWATDTGISGYSIRYAYDDEPAFYPGYSAATTLLIDANLDHKVSADYMNPGGGGAVIGMFYSISGDMYYNELSITDPTVQVSNLEGQTQADAVATVTASGTIGSTNGNALATAVATVTATGGYEYYATVNEDVPATLTVTGTVIPYDPIKTGIASAQGAAQAIVAGARNYAGQCAANAVAAISRALGGFLLEADPVTAIAQTQAEATGTIITEETQEPAPVDIEVVRGDTGKQEFVQNVLISSELVGIEYGRNLLDEYGQAVVDMTVSVLWKDNYRTGQVVHIQDELRGRTFIGKITGIKHGKRKIGDAVVTDLYVRVPIAEYQLPQPSFDLQTVSVSLLINGAPATIEFTVSAGTIISSVPTTVTVTGVPATVVAQNDTFIMASPATITATGQQSSIRADQNIVAAAVHAVVTGKPAQIAAGDNTTINTNAAHVTMTGKAATVQEDTTVLSTPATIQLTGRAAGVQADTTVVSTLAHISVIGPQATVQDDTTVSTSAAHLTAAGKQATVQGDTNVPAAAAHLTITGKAASVQGDTDVSTATAHLTVTGKAASVQEDTAVPANAAHLTVTGKASTVQEDTTVSSNAAHLTITGRAATIGGGTDISTTAANLTATGRQATIQHDTNVAATAAHMTVTGKPSTVQADTAVSTAASHLTATGKQATVQGDTTVSSTAAHATVTGKAATVQRDTTVSATAAHATVTGRGSTIQEGSGGGSSPTNVVTTPATVTFTPVAPTISRAGIDPTTVNATKATITLTGKQGTVVVEAVIATTAPTLTVTGAAATIVDTTAVVTSPATITFTPVDPTIVQ